MEHDRFMLYTAWISIGHYNTFYIGLTQTIKTPTFVEAFVCLTSMSAEDLKTLYSSIWETVRKRRKKSELHDRSRFHAHADFLCTWIPWVRKIWKIYVHQNEKQNVSEEKSQNFMIALAFILVLTFCAQDWIRTSTPRGAATWRRCVYQFRHLGRKLRCENKGYCEIFKELIKLLIPAP